MNDLHTQGHPKDAPKRLLSPHAFRLSTLSNYEPDLLILLRVLESYRKICGLEIIHVQGSKTLEELAREFSFNNISVSLTGQTQGAFDIDDILKSAKNSDVLEQDVLLRLLQPQSSRPAKCSLPLDQEYTFTRHTRLGDALSILTGLDTYCEVNNLANLKISGTGAFSEVAKHFRFKTINLSEFNSQKSGELELAFTHCSWRIPWLSRYSHSLVETFGGILPTEVIPPTLRRINLSQIAKENFIAAQFDSRSHAAPSPDFANKVLNRFFPGDDIRILGGPETPKYLGPTFKYETGDLGYLIERLLASRIFVGCDSGLAHLAGVLNVPSLVANYSDYESVFSFFKSYPSTIVVNRDITNLT